MEQRDALQQQRDFRERQQHDLLQHRQVCAA
jgi:hypothetical protein